MFKRLRLWLVPLVYLSDNWISLIGVVLVTSCAVFWLFFLPLMLGGGPGNPYAGILVYLLLPGAFLTSLLLIPLGIVLRRKAQGAAADSSQAPLKLDFGRPELRHLSGFVIGTTLVNLVIASQLSYAAVNYMETVQFCGQTCHTVMKPEFTAYQNSPHSRVRCAECHIGAGASWFVRSKLSGVRQVFAVTFGTYSRPIPTPVRNLRPARETCEQCHWPDRFNGDRLRILSKFSDDEKNTETKTVLLMHIGGGNGKGIHGMHVGPGISIRYASDESRQNIPWVSYQKGSNPPVLYQGEGFKPEKLGALTTRVMDCVDCHNRPSHAFELPDRAVEEAMGTGGISPSLPFAKKQSVAILKATYATSGDAVSQIPAAFEKFYRESYPDVYRQHRAEVERSARAVIAIFNRNVFPEMRVTWGSYPNNLGHTDFPGCFRCHDDAHTAAGGLKITQDCSACHSLLATEESSPKILTDLGLAAALFNTPAAPVETARNNAHTQ